MAWTGSGAAGKARVPRKRHSGRVAERSRCRKSRQKNHDVKNRGSVHSPEDADALPDALALAELDADAEPADEPDAALDADDALTYTVIFCDCTPDTSLSCNCAYYVPGLTSAWLGSVTHSSVCSSVVHVRSRRSSSELRMSR